MSRRIAINLVFFMGMFIVLLVMAARTIISVDFIDRPYRLEAEFESAVGIGANAEVAYLGVNYGIVEGARRSDDGVIVTMKIDRDKQIPEGSRAHIFRKSAIGEPFIDFFPPETVTDAYDGPYYEAGHLVTLESGLTDIPLEFSELLRSASRLLSSVDPAAADTLVHELAVGVSGRDEDLRRLALAGEQIAADFSERTDLLDSLAENNTRLTRVFADNRDAFGDAITNLSLVADELNNATPDLERLLQTGSEFAGTTADLIADELPVLDCILHDLEDVTRYLAQPEFSADLEYVLQNSPAALINVFNIRDIEPDGVWARVHLISDTSAPDAPAYEPPNELPPVPAIETCQSTLTSGGVDFIPTGGTPIGAPPARLPATGSNAAVLAGLALMGLAVVARRSLRREV